MSTTYAFIDAANLFYGGEKKLGWKIDYHKLLLYLKWKYAVAKAFYYAGVELHGFDYSLLEDKPLDLKGLYAYLSRQLNKSTLQKKHNDEIAIHLPRVKFYMKLKMFGYSLVLKPVKIYREGNRQVKKANCDVDMTLDLIRYMHDYQAALILSGDGDFVRALKYLQDKGKKVHILARGERSAREMKQLAGGDFRDFHKLRSTIEYQ